MTDYSERIAKLWRKYNDAGIASEGEFRASEECFDIAKELAAKLAAAEERDRFRGCDEGLPGLPEDSPREVEFIMTRRASHYAGVRAGLFHTGCFWYGGKAFQPSQVLCWRPAREVGEIPTEAK